MWNWCRCDFTTECDKSLRPGSQMEASCWGNCSAWLLESLARSYFCCQQTKSVHVGHVVIHAIGIFIKRSLSIPHVAACEPDASHLSSSDSQLLLRHTSLCVWRCIWLTHFSIRSCCCVSDVEFCCGGSSAPLHYQAKLIQVTSHHCFKDDVCCCSSFLVSWPTHWLAVSDSDSAPGVVKLFGLIGL